MKTDPRLGIPNRNSTDNEWLVWYQALKSTFGREIARQEFLLAWSTAGRGSIKANTSNLREVLKKEGINMPSNGIGGSLLDGYNDIADHIGGILNMGKTAGIIIGIIIIVPIGMFLFGIAKNPIEAIKASAPARESAAKAMAG